MIYLKILILVFVFITFLQSGLDKLTDWSGNAGWLNEHFKDTVIQGWVPLALGILVLFEIAVTGATLMAFYELWIGEGSYWGEMSLVLSAVTLLMLLLGQRLAKDYDGARTIVIYLMPVFFGLYLFAV